MLEQLATMVTYNDWTSNDAHLTVVDDGHKIIIGRDIFNSLGLAVVQQQEGNGKCVNNINNSTCKIKDTIADQFPHFGSKDWPFKDTCSEIQVPSKVYSKAPKGRRVPINLQPRSRRN